MGKRRESRECALKLLYQLDLTSKRKGYKGGFLEKILKAFWEQNDMALEQREFTSVLVKGVLDNLEKIDEFLTSHSTNWKLNRMAYVDRNVMRIAVYEMLFCEDIPIKVTINEAVDIAKAYGDSLSGAFVNGILDNIAKELGKKE